MGMTTKKAGVRVRTGSRNRSRQGNRTSWERIRVWTERVRVGSPETGRSGRGTPDETGDRLR